MQSKEFSLEVSGRTLSAKFTDLADQANGSVIVQYGNTIVLATAVMSPHTREGLDYFPLTVDYEEKFYAAGQILGSRFMRREGKPSEEAVLSGRMVDRTIRPLFDQHIRNEVQVVLTVLSIAEDDPDVLAINAASLALATSDIPWRGPTSAVRIGKHKGNDTWLINPTYAERNDPACELDLLACGQGGTINMIEVASKEVSEEVLVAALEKARGVLTECEQFQHEIIKKIGKKKVQVVKPETPEQLAALFAEHIEPRLFGAVFSNEPGKRAIHTLMNEWKALAAERLPDVGSALVDHLFEDEVDRVLHEGALVKGMRADGRAFDEIRPLFAQAGGISPILHGSGIFYRGGTHVFSALTLGGPQDSLLIDSMEEREEKKHFMHHYNFPPFSSGETGRMGGTNRRMIGHGALAEKALVPVIPPKETFPYTIRIVSESMASNGSTSMASVCASTLALMDGGVPIAAPVAGIAMGLLSQGDQYKILTDIQGPEDHYGDMDFKVAGTSRGVTAIQLDIKVDGIAIPILAEALAQAKKAREEILSVIVQAIPAPRETISPNAPKIIGLKIKTDQIGMVIGPGGKNIRAIKERTGAEEIDIEDDGSVFVTGKAGSAEKAAQIIIDMTREYSAGERFEGVVSRIATFGAFVRLNESAEGLVHISEIAPFRIDSVQQALSVGEKVQVVIREIDEQGRINLSIKDADPEFASRKGLTPSTQPPLSRNGNNRNHGPREKRVDRRF